MSISHFGFPSAASASMHPDLAIATKLSAKKRRQEQRLPKKLRVLSFALAMAALSSTAHAASGTFTNGDANNIWQDNLNWSVAPFPGTTTAAFTSTDVGTFSTTGSGTITLGGTGIINVQNINFGVSGGDANTFTIGASTDVFDFTSSTTTAAGGVIVAAGVTHAEQIGVAGTTLNMSTTGGQNTSFFNNGTGLLTVGGNILGNAASGATDNLIFGGTGTGNTTVTGNISSATAGTVTFVRDGSSTNTVTLTGTTTTNNGVFLARSGVTNINGAVNTGTALFEVGGSNGTALSGATVNVAANVTANNMNIGNANGANFRTGAVYQTAGIVSVTQGASSTNFQLGNAAISTTTPSQGSGYYRLSGGTLTSNEFDIAGVGVAGSTTTGTVGVMEVTGGTVTSNGYLTIGRGTGISAGLVNVTGGTFNTAATAGATGPIALNWTTAAGGQGVLNVGGGSGAAAVTGGAGTTQTAAFAGRGLNLAETTTAGTLGIANLLTNGTLTVSDVVASQGATATSQLNFNGGTLKATTTNLGATFLASTNITAVNVYRNGGTIDNSGTNITIANAMVTPAGYGASSASTVAVPSGGSGYVGAPLVKLTGGTGVGAVGYATVANGVVTGIVITGRGTGYTAGDTLTATFFGGLGNGGTAATTVTGLTVAANVSGGMAFVGTGTTTLSGANTYTGGTTVTGGGLLLAATGSLASTSVSVTGSGTLTLQGTTTLADTSLLSLVSGTTLNLSAASGSETIGSLSLDGTGVAPGTYTAAQLTARDGAITFTTAGETLTVTTAIPEPSAWVMMLGGLAGLIGWTVRRKRCA